VKRKKALTCENVIRGAYNGGWHENENFDNSWNLIHMFKKLFAYATLQRENDHDENISASTVLFHSFVW
jgi:hypothetical protein